MTDAAAVVENTSDALSQTLGEARDALLVWGFRTTATEPDIIMAQAKAHAHAWVSAGLRKPVGEWTDEEKARTEANAAISEAVWDAAMSVLERASTLIRALKLGDVDGAVLAGIGLGHARCALLLGTSEGTEKVFNILVGKDLANRKTAAKLRNKDWDTRARRIREERPEMTAWGAAKAISDETGHEDEKVIYESIRHLWGS